MCSMIWCTGSFWTSLTSVSWWVRVPSLSYNAGYTALRATASTATYIMQHYFSSGGLITLSSGSAAVTQAYAINTWYHFELRNINWTNHTFDYYVDGALRGVALSFFDATAASITRIDLYDSSASSTAYWDEIVFQ